MRFYQISLNNLRRRKVKVALILLGLAVGVATIVAVYLVTSAMEAAIKRQMSELGAAIVITASSGELAFNYGDLVIPDLIFDPKQLTEADLALIKELPGSPSIRAVAPKLSGMANSGSKQLMVAGSNLGAELTVKPWLRLQEETEPEEAASDEEHSTGKEMSYVRPDLSRGDPELVLEDSQVLLGALLAADLGLKPGETIYLDGNGLQVAAILEEAGSVEDRQVLINLSTAQALFQRPGEVTFIEIAADYSTISEEELIAQLAEALPHARITSVQQAVTGRFKIASSLTRFGRSVSILVFICGLLVVALNMSTAVRERTREIGIFRAIGFRSSQIFRIILLEGALISLSGGVLGYLSGFLAARLAGPLAAMPVPHLSWRWDLFLLTIIVTALAGALAGAYPAYRASRLDPVEALRFY